MKILSVFALILLSTPLLALEVGLLSGNVENVIDRTLTIEGQTLRSSGYAPTVPDWIKPGASATVSYACDELGDCFYIDIVPLNESTPIRDKINAELLEYRRIFPRE